MSSKKTKALTYRVESIPAGTTRQDLINKFFYREDHQYLEVKSLFASVDDYGDDEDEKELTATVLFKQSESRSEERLKGFEDAEVQITKEFYGFTPLYVPPKAKGEINVDIIAVTGLAGHAFGSWAYSEKKMWLRDYLPKDAPNARILTYGYDSALVNSSSHSTLQDFATGFLNSLATIRKSCESRPIIFIGHSLGCIIIKKTITDHEVLGLSRLPVRTIIFLASPNGGLHNTALQHLVKGRPSETLIRELSRNSPTLIDINQRFKARVQGVNIVSVYETLPTPTVILDNCEWVRKGEPVMMVDHSSAILGLSNEKSMPSTTDHSGIARLEKGQGGIYNFIIGAIHEGLRPVMDIVKEATKNQQSRSFDTESLPTDSDLMNRSKSRKIHDRRLSHVGGATRSAHLGHKAATAETRISKVGVDQQDQGSAHAVTFREPSDSAGPTIPIKAQSLPAPIHDQFLESVSGSHPKSHHPVESLGHVDAFDSSNQVSHSPMMDQSMRRWNSDTATDTMSEQCTLVEEKTGNSMSKDEASLQCGTTQWDISKLKTFVPDNKAHPELKPNAEGVTSHACRHCETSVTTYDFHFQCPTCVDDGNNYGDQDERDADSSEYDDDSSEDSYGEDNSTFDNSGGQMGAGCVCPNCHRAKPWCPKHNCILRKYAIKQRPNGCRFVLHVDSDVLRSDNAVFSAIKRNNPEDLRRAAQERKLLNMCYGDGSTPLHLSAQLGNVECTRTLLDLRPRKDVQNDKGNTPLMDAIEYDHLEVVRDLLDHSVDIEKLNEFSGLTALGCAAKWGLNDIVDILLHHNAMTEHTGMDSLSPLFLAVIGKDEESVRLLIQAGANVGVKNEVNGDTPLHEAASAGLVEISKLLLDNHAVLDDINSDGETPLHLSVICDHPEVTKLLLETGANSRVKSDEGYTPLQVAVLDGNEAQLQALLDADASVRVKDESDGNSPLHESASSGDSSIVAILLSKGVAVDSLNYSSQTALHCSVDNNQVEVTKILLQAGANANLFNNNGYTPLHIAAEKNSVVIVELLLRHGCDPNRTDHEGRTPLLIAASFNQSALCRKLLEARANPNIPDENGNTPLHLAARNDSVDIVDLLLKNRSDCEQLDDEGRTPLMATAYFDSYASCRRLLEAGAWTEARHPSDGRTALSLACGNNNYRTVQILLEYQADPDSTDAKGFTCLWDAAREDKFDICRALLGHGASVDMNGIEHGDSALNIASWLGRCQIVSLLLENSANPQREGSRGDPPLYGAASAGHTDVCQALLQDQADVDKEISHDPRGLWNGTNAVSTAAYHGHMETLDFLFYHGASGQPPTALAGKWKNQPFSDNVPMWTRREILERLREAKRTNGGRRSSKFRIFGRT